MLTDGNGIPLAVVVDGANRNDDKLLAATLDEIVVSRPASSSEEEEEAPEHLCLDAGCYDSKAVREEVEELRGGYEAHIRRRRDKKKRREDEKHHPGAKARRWVVERTHSWLNRFGDF